jgi:hypothetical protein
MPLIARYDNAGTRIADFNLTSTMVTRINTATSNIPAARLNPWRLATFNGGSGNITVYVQKSGSTYTEMRNT